MSLRRAAIGALLALTLASPLGAVERRGSGGIVDAWFAVGRALWSALGTVDRVSDQERDKTTTATPRPLRTASTSDRATIDPWGAPAPPSPGGSTAAPGGAPSASPQ